MEHTHLEREDGVKVMLLAAKHHQRSPANHQKPGGDGAQGPLPASEWKHPCLGLVVPAAVKQ